MGGDTIPPSYRVTTPINMNSNGRGPTLTESMKEREDVLQKVHSITNGHGIKSNPARLETLSKWIIEKSDKKSLKVPSHATSQLTEFLLHNPDILIGPISGIVLFEVVYINKWSTPQEAASWLHEPASMYEVIPSKPISTEEFTAKQLQWECMKAIQAVS